MKNISIFARKPLFFRRTHYYNYPHLQRGSSIIRGEQMVKYLGAKYNPVGGYEYDVRIYVKPQSLDVLNNGSYVDIVDSVRVLRNILQYPSLWAIVLSKAGERWLRSKGKEKVVVIPQHHCNIENFRKEKKEIVTVGVIGSEDTFSQPLGWFSGEMEKIGLRFITSFSWKSREEVVDFYKRIDIQVAWNKERNRQKSIRDSLRIKNAASFGIPTVAYPEINYEEFEGNYIKVKTIEGLIEEVRKLKDKTYYDKWSERVFEKAQEFHISKIAEMYRRLE
jgi:hypothetical protein